MKKPVVHFEIGCDNLSKTLKFYREVFNWEIVEQGISASVDTGLDNGISGHITQLGHEPHRYITFYIETDTLEEDLVKLQSLGGTKMLGPLPVPGGRRFAWFKDPVGNMVGLITPLTTKKSPAALVKEWFHKWEVGSYRDLPIAENFQHTSPFGTISGKEAYLEIVAENEDKFLGHSFEILDELYSENKACICYRAIKGEHQLEVSEWQYFKDDLIQEIVAHYHIGEIREERKLNM